MATKQIWFGVSGYLLRKLNGILFELCGVAVLVPIIVLGGNDLVHPSSVDCGEIKYLVDLSPFMSCSRFLEPENLFYIKLRGGGYGGAPVEVGVSDKVIDGIALEDFLVARVPEGLLVLVLNFSATTTSLFPLGLSSSGSSSPLRGMQSGPKFRFLCLLLFILALHLHCYKIATLLLKWAPTQPMHPPSIFTVLLGSLNARPVAALPVQMSVNIEQDRDTQNDTFDSEVMYMKLLEQDPRNVEALKVLINGKMRKGKIKEAVKDVERLIDIEPDEVEWRLLQALCYEMAGQLSKAKRLFKEILKERPLMLRALHGLAMVMHKNHEGSAVFEMLNKALELASRERRVTEERNIRILIAQLIVIKGDLDGGLKKFQDLVNDNPRDFRPYLCQGIIYSLQDKKKEAEEQFEIYRRNSSSTNPSFLLPDLELLRSQPIDEERPTKTSRIGEDKT
ncbi:hypothetical protein Nepgr_008494 [Nepenthes gracilis]|uniref:Uncharacterized protein n=1 Tax=Nepenthes gracilis TaxID=150966 RepID=A0AAD3S9D9_NEPGR|nr:hypothetical protein Nepgr_008494 [Nepenthes gracilis]